MNLILPQTGTTERTAALLRAWAYVQHELLHIFWGLMEVALLTPLLLTVMPWARYWEAGRTLLWLLLIMLFAFNLARLLSVLKLPADHQRTIMALVLFFFIFFAVRELVHQPASLFDLRWLRQFAMDIAERGNLRWTQVVGLFIAIVMMWTRGLALVNREFDINRIGLWLRIGGLILAPFIIWLGAQQRGRDVTPTAVSLIRAEQVEKLRSGRSTSLNPRWLSMIFIAGILTIFTAGLMAVIISGESAFAIVGWLAPLVIALQFTLSIAFSTLLFVAIPVLELLDILVNGLSQLLAWVWLGVQNLFLVLNKIMSKVATAAPPGT